MAQQVREHVGRRVQELTGVSVHRIDIDVVAAGYRSDDHRTGGLR